MAVRYLIEDQVCLITLDNPPVNVIGQALRAGLVAALEAAEAAGVQRIILTGAGAAFAAGADAREFDTPPVPPHLPDVLARLERLPAIAAINGTALGGGLEIALACRYRIAAPKALLGLPEVTLGVVPGAGGTQRLPRIIGMAKAADLIAEGRTFLAPEALDLGVIDAIAADPVQAARRLPDAVLACHLAAADRPTPAPEPLTTARARAAKRTAGQVAPQVALDLVEAATLPLPEGLARERAAFLALRDSDQARALRHVFFAERAAMGRKPAAPATEITQAVVVGGGTMGAGIAYALDGIGIAVTLVETGAEAAIRARANLQNLFDEAVRRGKLTPEAATARAAGIAVVTGYDALPPAQIAIEAAFEDMAVKRAIFAALDAALPETTVLATNTSYLDVNRIAEGIRHPDRLLGLHFFSPAHVMKLLEVIRASATSDTTFATALRLAQRLKKLPVEAGVCDGFIGNRILTRYRQTTDILLMDGALPWEVDAALEGFGMAMGPYAVQDLSGLDIAYANRQRKNLKAQPGVRYIPIADRMVEELKRLGRKTGAGWYDHGGASPAPSAEVAALIAESSVAAGIRRRAIPAGEIVERAITAMIAEGFDILEEGIARRPADIDLVLIHGYAFPRWRGGPMHHADTLGLPQLLSRITGYAAQDPLSWRVPPLLSRLVAEGRRLADLNLSERA
ncbi:3-hydroxyacyl-CoA dehydrogenase [Gemmobacter aquatilis]|uniref:3-hydroxyacyl-CoA dehydrogenase n=1 Tax=Gemmobacter aquatilis TaxID=933059 RepID=A0A1H8GQF9_9RHOB|nr:3-hydroxyacyl-CoA dehydrogenase NAD-binding domain-containing protein [Gemmobacter aquatilis]SEN46351.1 3-hydroxyacyl-CoA dehydrogenase [Gemmobacter aquatilis]